MKDIRDFIKDTVVYGFGKGVSKFFGLFLLPIYTRALSPADYGILDILSIIVYCLSTILTMGLDSASARYFFEVDSKKKKGVVLFTSFIARAASFVPVFFMITLLLLLGGNHRFGEIQSNIMIITLLLVPLGILTGEQTQHFRFYFEKWKYNLVLGIRLVFHFICGLVLVMLLKKGVMGAQLATLVGLVLFLTVSLVFHYRNYIAMFSYSLMKKMLAYGLPLVPAGLAIWVMLYCDRLFILHYYGYYDIGLYSIAARLSGAIGLLSIATQMSYGPFALSIYKNEGAREVFSQSWRMFLVIGITISACISIFGKEIVAILTPLKYHVSYIAIPFLALAQVFIQSVQFVGLGLSIIKKTKFFAIGATAAAAANVILNIILVPRYSYIGAAIATLVSYAAYLVYIYIMAQKNYLIDYKIKRIIAYSLTITSLCIIIPSLEYCKNMNIGIGVKFVILLIAFISPFMFQVIKIQNMITLFSKLYRDAVNSINKK